MSTISQDEILEYLFDICEYPTASNTGNNVFIFLVSILSVEISDNENSPAAMPFSTEVNKNLQRKVHCEKKQDKKRRRKYKERRDFIFNLKNLDPGGPNRICKNMHHLDHPYARNEKTAKNIGSISSPLPTGKRKAIAVITSSNIMVDNATSEINSSTDTASEDEDISPDSSRSSIHNMRDEPEEDPLADCTEKLKTKEEIHEEQTELLTQELLQLSSASLSLDNHIFNNNQEEEKEKEVHSNLRIRAPDIRKIQRLLQQAIILAYIKDPDHDRSRQFATDLTKVMHVYTDLISGSKNSEDHQVCSNPMPLKKTSISVFEEAGNSENGHDSQSDQFILPDIHQPKIQNKKGESLKKQDRRVNESKGFSAIITNSDVDRREDSEDDALVLVKEEPLDDEFECLQNNMDITHAYTKEEVSEYSKDHHDTINMYRNQDEEGALTQDDSGLCVEDMPFIQKGKNVPLEPETCKSGYLATQIQSK